MKRLIFEELLLMSALHKRARRITFGPRATVITGDNETGKSAIIKSLYAAFGAIPPVTDQAWRNAEVITLLRFKTDGHRYAILCEGEAYTLFDGNDRLIDTYPNVRGGLAAKLSEIFDFKLRFYSSKGDSRSAHPSYLFAPFYVDQIKGWANPWSSFAAIKANRRADTLEYHVGIRPNAYFEAKTLLQELQEELVRPLQEMETLNRILNDIGDRFTDDSLNLDTGAFAEEVGRLIAVCQELRMKEERYRDRLMRYENERLSLETQTDLMIKAADELRKDYKFAVRRNEDSIECPLCGAHYENSIVERFLIAQDEDRCVNFVSQLDQETAKVDEQIRVEREQFADVESELSRINALLDSRREESSLRQIIQAEGKRELREKVSGDIAELAASSDKLSLRMQEAKRDMREATDKKLKKQIKQQYASLIQNFALRLSVSPIPKTMVKNIAPKIVANGSDLPRRLLAYYVALLHTIHQNTSGLYAPFVVDAVNQLDQGEDNLVRMLEVLADGLPEGTQLILSCVDIRNISFKGEEIKLTEKRGVLRAEDFDQVAAIVRPFIESKYQADRPQ